MATTLLLGKDAEFCYGTAGVEATSVVPNVTDVSLELSTDEIDTTTRDTGGFKTAAVTLKSVSVNLTMFAEASSSAYTAFVNAWTNQTAISIRVLDKASGRGLRCDANVMNFSRKEGIGDVISHDVTLKPANTSVTPTFV